MRNSLIARRGPRTGCRSRYEAGQYRQQREREMALFQFVANESVPA